MPSTHRSLDGEPSSPLWCEPVRHCLASGRVSCCMRHLEHLANVLRVTETIVTSPRSSRGSERRTVLSPVTTTGGATTAQWALHDAGQRPDSREQRPGRHTTPRSCGLQGFTPLAYPFEPGVTGTRRYSHGVSLLQGRSSTARLVIWHRRTSFPMPPGPRRPS